VTPNIHIYNFYEDTKVQINLQKGEKCNYCEVVKSCAMHRIKGPKYVNYCLVSDMYATLCDVHVHFLKNWNL
jgi:hypothetical protein